MASVLKLRLQGIRAFDNYSSQELEFSTPLTLICGPNGVGKTTIIEALRYVTTGDLPPNAKGGAFVHDPRMAAEAEVYAQVKLLYTDSQSHRMVVTRSMRLSISAKGTATFKTLEGQLKVYGENGEAGAVSSRCADLNTQIPLSLGVPAPILNFVIFCHQEDSLWPLSEPSIVKKRFDEIFEATKYSKALESLKTIRKDYVAGIRVDKVNVEHLEADRLRVEEKQRQLTALEDRVDSLSVECRQIQEFRKMKTTELNNAVALSQEFQQLEYALKDAQRSAARLAQDVELLQTETEVLEEPTAVLEKELAEWNTRATELGTKLSELQSQRKKLDDEADSIRQTLAVLSNQQGRIEQALEAHEVTLKKRNDLSGSQLPHLYRQELEKQRTELDESIDEIEVSHRQREAELSQMVSAREAKVLTLKQTIMDRRTFAREADAKVATLQKQIDEHDREHTKTDLQYMKTALLDLEAQEAEARNSVLDLTDDNKINDAQSRVAEKELRVQRARTNLQEAIEASSIQSRLVFLRDSLCDAEKHQANALEQIRDILKAPDATSEDAEAEISGLEASKVKSDEKRGQLEMELSASETSDAKVNARIDSLREESAKIEAALTVSPNEFEAALKEAEEDILITTENREQAAFAHRFFAEAIAKAKSETPVCLLCDHHQSRGEADEFVTRLIARIDALPMSPEIAAQEAESARNQVETLRSQAPQVQRWHQIKTELADLAVTSSKTHADVDSCRLKLNEAAEEANAVADKYEQLRMVLSRPLKEFSRSKDDIRDTQAKIETEAAIISTTETQTPQEAQEALDQAETALRESRAQLESLREEERRRQHRVQSLEQRVSNLKLRISEYDLATAKRQQAEQAQSDARESAIGARNELNAAQQELPEAEKAVIDAQATLRTMKHEFATNERTLAQKRSTVVDAMREFDALESELLAFEAQHGSNPLARIEAEQSSVRSKNEAIELSISELHEDITQNERMQADLGSHQRRLRDNLRLRRLKEELRVSQQKESEVAAKYRDSQAQMGDYENHIEKLQDVVSSANAEIAAKTGEAKAMSEQIRQVQHELATTYKDTADQYRQAVAQLQSNEGAAEDLVKYVRALDAAIMRYHSLKMAEINSLLDELWKRTYTGTDIDTILIRSESDAGSTSTRASYNYRVCMVKQDTELDMRGRCSAGQKVLASILIRMALAECFGNSLGLIVLDEPTTNLDHENIEALARSLSDIIASRQSQRNFQLIVITHDEHFLTQMSPANYCSWYYRIQRNSRQLSTIKRLPITSLS